MNLELRRLRLPKAHLSICREEGEIKEPKQRDSPDNWLVGDLKCNNWQDEVQVAVWLFCKLKASQGCKKRRFMQLLVCLQPSKYRSGPAACFQPYFPGNWRAAGRWSQLNLERSRFQQRTAPRHGLMFEGPRGATCTRTCCKCAANGVNA